MPVFLRVGNPEQADEKRSCAVILSAAKDLRLCLSLRVNSAKGLCIWIFKQLPGSFLRFTQDGLRPLRMTA